MSTRDQRPSLAKSNGTKPKVVSKAWCLYCNTKLKQTHAAVAHHLRKYHGMTQDDELKLSAVMNNIDRSRASSNAAANPGASTQTAKQKDSEEKNEKKRFLKFVKALEDPALRRPNRLKELLHSKLLDPAFEFAAKHYELHRNIDPFSRLLTGFEQTPAYQQIQNHLYPRSPTGPETTSPYWLIQSWLNERYGLEIKTPTKATVLKALKSRAGCNVLMQTSLSLYLARVKFSESAPPISSDNAPDTKGRAPSVKEPIGKNRNTIQIGMPKP